MTKTYLGFHSGIEPGRCARFLENDQLKIWTTFLLLKLHFLTKMTCGYLICSTGRSSFSFIVFFIRTGHVLLTWSSCCLGHLQRIEPLDLDQKLSSFLFWNWTKSLCTVFSFWYFKELNHFFTLETALFLKNHLRLPNMLHPQVLLFILAVFSLNGSQL